MQIRPKVYLAIYAAMRGLVKKPLTWWIRWNIWLHTKTKGRMGKHLWKEHLHKSTGIAKRTCVICYHTDYGRWYPRYFNKLRKAQ